MSYGFQTKDDGCHYTSNNKINCIIMIKQFDFLKFL